MSIRSDGDENLNTLAFGMIVYSGVREHTALVQCSVFMLSSKQICPNMAGMTCNQSST